jgi:uncharacterized protein (DUF2344 family)
MNEVQAFCQQMIDNDVLMICYKEIGEVVLSEIERFRVSRIDVEVPSRRKFLKNAEYFKIASEAGENQEQTIIGLNELSN